MRESWQSELIALLTSDYRYCQVVQRFALMRNVALEDLSKVVDRESEFKLNQDQFALFSSPKHSEKEGRTKDAINLNVARVW